MHYFHQLTFKCGAAQMFLTILLLYWLISQHCVEKTTNQFGKFLRIQYSYNLFLLGEYTVSVMLSPDITRTVHKFSPGKLRLCHNLTNLNILNCFELDTKLFTDCVKFWSNLQVFSFVNCTQFTEQEITYILTSLPNLYYVDGTGTQDIIFCNALNIVCSLMKLEAINLEPKYLYFERNDWTRLISQFKSISFGCSITRMLPNKL